MDEMFTTHIRWRSTVDPHWEVQSIHCGFGSGEEAALFANGLSGDGACRLWLSNGLFALELTGGRRLPLPGVVKIWRLDDEPSSAPEEARFSLIGQALPWHLSKAGLDGEFYARQFLVVAPSGMQITTGVEVDKERRIVRVTMSTPEMIPEDQFPFRIPLA